MNLIELILEYNRLLRKHGFDHAHRFLINTGVHQEVRFAIERTSNGDGELVDSSGRRMAIMRYTNTFLPAT